LPEDGSYIPYSFEVDDSMIDEDWRGLTFYHG
jgi:hypothetical protein